MFESKMKKLRKIQTITDVANFEDEDFDMELWRTINQSIDQMIHQTAKEGKYSLNWEFDKKNKLVYEMIAREYRREGFHACISSEEGEYNLHISWSY